MRRRDLIVMLFGGTAVAASRLARAHQLERMRRIGVLMGFDSTNPEAQTFQKAFTGRLRELGWIDGRNARFEYRWASGTPNVSRLMRQNWSASSPMSSSPIQRLRSPPCAMKP